MNKKNLQVAVKVFVSTVLIGFIIWSADLDNLAKYLAEFNLFYIPLIVVFIIINYVVSSYRWKQLLIFENTSHISVLYLIKLYFLGSFFNNFMPTSIGGDVYKVYRLGKDIGSASNAFSATFMERFTGMLALVFISIVGFVGFMLTGSGYELDVIKIAGVVALLGLGMFIGIYLGLKILDIARRKISKFNKIYDSLIAYKGQNKVLALAFLSSFIVQFMSIFSQYFILVGIGYTPEIFKSLFIFPVITLAGFFIPSLNGIGVQDVLYNFSNSFLGITASAALAGSFLYHMFRLGVSLIGGFLYAVDRTE